MKTTDIITIQAIIGREELLYWSMENKEFVHAKNKCSELNRTEAERAIDLIMSSDQYKDPSYKAIKLIRTISTTFTVNDQN